jgi:hypothetical protein
MKKYYILHCSGLGQRVFRFQIDAIECAYEGLEIDLLDDRTKTYRYWIEVKLMTEEEYLQTQV